jgi:hypothetical protein
MTVDRRPLRRSTPRPDRLGQPRRNAALQRLRTALRANLARTDDELPPPDATADSADIDEATVPAPPAGEEDLPENTIYPDEGCHVAPACLSCPLPACIYDRPISAGKAARRERDRRIRVLAARGWSSARLAAVFHLSPAQVRRIRGRQRARTQRGRSTE